MGLFKTDQEKRAKAFYKAIVRNDVAAITSLVATGIAADDRDEQLDMTPLCIAAQNGALEAAAYFLNAEANANFAQKDGTTILMIAAKQGHAEIARLLLDHGADLKCRQRGTEETALHIAAAQGRGNIVKMLLEAGADKTAHDQHLRTAADVASSSTTSIQRAIVNLINDWGKKPPEDGKPVKEPGDSPAASKADDSPAAKSAAPLPPADGWRLSGISEVTNITRQEDIGYRLTETFNFRSGVYARIALNLETGAESQTIRFFDEFGNSPLLERAREALKQLGGMEPPETGRRIDKPGLSRNFR